MQGKLIVSSSPHIRTDENVSVIMLDVIISLLPALAAAVFFFRVRALMLVLISVIFCVLFEYGYQKLMKKPVTIGDLSAVVTGILLAFNLPVTVPLWMPIIGSFVAIVITKQLFGGIGKNFMNPALVGRAFLLSWVGHMTNFVKPLEYPWFQMEIDAVSSPTPLSFLKSGNLPDVSLFQLFIGNRGGCLGETGIFVLLVGGIYLLYRKVITWHIPASFIGTVALLTYIFPRNADRLEYMLAEIMSGGLILGAIYMATDYSTSPVTPKGKLIFGIGCGLLTVLIRYFGGYPEGVSFAILIMNPLAWGLDKITRPVRYGTKGAKK